MAFSSMRSLSVLAACAALLSSACVIRFGPIEDDGSDWETSAQTGGNGGSAGEGGSAEGGAGGSDGGAGGTSNNSSSSNTGGSGGGEPYTTSSSSSSSSGAGGGGGDPYCVDEVGTGVTVDVCDTLAVAPSTSGMCDYNEPLGYLACQRSFELFAPGHAENLVSCLNNIPAYEACSELPVSKCVDTMYDEACSNSFVEDTCDSWGQLCQGDGQPFNVAQCKAQLNPFSDAGLTDMVNCMNTQSTCQGGYNLCLDQLMTLE